MRTFQLNCLKFYNNQLKQHRSTNWNKCFYKIKLQIQNQYIKKTDSLNDFKQGIADKVDLGIFTPEKKNTFRNLANC